jgi:hypothetical protein
MPPPGPRPADPYRVLGLSPEATLPEVKRAYRALAKRHHPDTAGPHATARFLAIQHAYEEIVAGRGRPARTSPPGRGERRAATDWYAEARDAARGRARQGRGESRRAGTAGAGAADGASRRRTDEPGRGRGGERAGRAGPQDRGRPSPRTATIGSTTYDDAVTGEPPWDGAAWYGAASGTYWTVNPREYADPRKHGPEYLARAAAAARDAASRRSARDPARRREAAEDVPAAGGGGERPRHATQDADTPPADARDRGDAASRGAGVVGRLRRALRQSGPDPRVR